MYSSVLNGLDILNLTKRNFAVAYGVRTRKVSVYFITYGNAGADEAVSDDARGAILRVMFSSICSRLGEHNRALPKHDWFNA